MDRRRTKRVSVALATLLALALVAAACGDDSGGGSTSGTAGSTGSTGEAAGTPVRGGKLVYGLEADTANPWAPYEASCAISCYQVYNTVSDPLVVADDNGKLTPYLLQSMTPSADYKQWTFTARDGIRFHDGTVLDGAAMKYNIDTCRAAPLTAAAFAPIVKTEAEGQSVTLTTSLPMVALPGLFTGQCGYMFSPKWLMSLPTNPLRQGPLADPQTAATPPTGKDTEPVGLGAFKFKSYQPGNGNSFDAVRNDDYWRKDDGLPYLDEVELVVAVDIDSRSNGLRSGQFNIMHTDNGDEIAKYNDDKSFNQVTSDAYAETGYVMLNVAEGTNPTYASLTGKDGTMDPKGSNADSPLLDEDCRRALAEAIDLDRIVKERTAGIDKPANGPFPPGSLGYLEDSGYPKYDVKAAQADMDKCLAAIGKPAAEFTYNTTNDPFNVETNQLVISMWKDAFGDKVKTSVTPVEQGQYIGLALVGTFNAFSWRNHGGVDPDQQFVWWFSGLSAPIGQSAINFGRFQDPDIDAALLAQRTMPDPGARKAAAEAINRSFGKHVWNLWFWWDTWGIQSNKKVQDVTKLALPGGTGTVAPLISGHHGIAQIWCTGGKCS